MCSGGASLLVSTNANAVSRWESQAAVASRSASPQSPRGKEQADPPLRRASTYPPTSPTSSSSSASTTPPQIPKRRSSLTQPALALPLQILALTQLADELEEDEDGDVLYSSSDDEDEEEEELEVES